MYICKKYKIMKKLLNLLVIVGVLITSCSEQKNNKTIDYGFNKKDTSYSPNSLEIKCISTTIFNKKDSCNHLKFSLDTSFMVNKSDFDVKSGEFMDKWVKSVIPEIEYNIFITGLNHNSQLISLTKNEVDTMFKKMDLIVNNPNKLLQFDIEHSKYKDITQMGIVSIHNEIGIRISYRYKANINVESVMISISFEEYNIMKKNYYERNII